MYSFNWETCSSTERAVMDVQGKVILVTGGASGIGLGIVKELLEQEAKGVAIVDISEDSGRRALEEIETNFPKGKAIFVATDVTEESQLEGAFERIVQEYGQLDVVVNNAGISNETEWKKVVDINLTAVIRGTYLAMKKYLPRYKSGNQGIIVNISSLMGLDPSSVSPVYSATKHALVALGRTLGHEEFYKMHQVKILTICPGAVRTDLLKGSATVKSALPHMVKKEFERFGVRTQPVKCVADCVIELMKLGENGSIWVVENGESPYEVVLPDRKAMRKQKTASQTV